MRRTLIYFLLFVIPCLAQNILNNGGFESGLMCYSDWMWSKTGVDFAGDYKFSLSSDAHSGNYSLSIACGGSDCLRAAIISDYIPVPANQSYQLSVWAKCTYNTLSFMYTTNPGTAKYFICDGNWHQNQMSFQTGPTAGYMFYYLFNTDVGTLLIDDVTLTYGDGTAPVHTAMHAGVRNVNISGQNVMVDGAPFLSLGFFDVGYNDLAQVAATGANTINGLPTYNTTDCFNLGQTSYLDKVYELGLNFVPDSSTTAWMNNPAVLPNTTQTFGPHLANIAWFLADEPDLPNVSWHYIPANTFLLESSAAKMGTSLPMTADFQHAAYGTTSDISPYNGSADIWMAEPYGPDFGSVNHAVNLFNSIQRRPIWLAQDAIDASLIVPKAYWAVIAGATGIHYFTWDGFKADPAKVAAATQVFGELKGLKNAIFGYSVDSLVTAPSGIASMSRFDPAANTVYILSANSAASTVQANFMVQGLTAGQTVTVLYENRTITAHSGFFSDSFAGVSRHVYAIHPANTSLSATIVSKTGLPASRDWKIQVSNGGLTAANSAQITSMTLNATGGTNCSPTIAPGTFPMALGNLAPGQSASGDVLINFAGCDSTSKFNVKITIGANAGATSTTIVRNNERE
jgi:hypothetical protein